MGECKQQLRNLLDSASDLVQISSPDGNLLYTNPAWRDALSYSQADIEHLSFFDLVHPDCRDCCREAFASVLSREGGCHVNASLMAKDGRTIVVEGQIAGRVEEGKPPEIWSLWHNTTECQITDAIQQESVAGNPSGGDRPSAVADGTVPPPDIDIIHSLEDAVRSVCSQTFDFFYLNPSAEKIYGRAACEFFDNPKLWWEVIHPQDRDRVEAATQILLKTGSQDLEYRIMRPDGTMRWIRDRARTIYDLNGIAIRIDGITTDITKRKQIEHQLKWSQRFVHKILNAVADPIFVKDERHCWVLVNNAFCNLLGYSREKLIGKSDYDFFPQEEADVFWEKDELVFRTGVENENEEYLTDIRGNLHLISTKKSIFQDVKGKKLLVGTIRDLTERKRAESEILRALAREKELNELKSSFVSLVSHEFRTPLTTIQSSLDILEHFPCSEAEKQDLFGQVKKAIAQIVQLMEDVLFISRAEAGTLKFHPTRCDVDSLCRQVIAELETSTGREHNLVFGSQQSGCTRFCLDEKLLRQILSHLLSNAVKYSSAGSPVKLEVVCQDRQVTFRVRDWGIGISPENRQKLFELFHRTSNIGTISGMGLGLAIVKHCVDLHGGQISVDSEVGRGTTFTVALPLKQEELNSENDSSD